MKHKLDGIRGKLHSEAVTLIVLGSLFIIISLMVADVTLSDQILIEVTFIENRDEEQFVRNLREGMSIEQTFSANHDFEFITLSCSDHEMLIEGKTIIYIRDNEYGKLVANEEIENYNIQYGVPVRVYFSGIEGKSYTVTIMASGTTDDAIGFFGYFPDEGETAIINGEKSEYALSIGTHTSTKIFWYLSIIVISIMIIGIMVLIYQLCRKNPAPQHIFLMLAIPIGVAFLCFASVNYVNDGDTHFARVYHYSNVILGINDYGNLNAITMRKDDLDTLYASECNTARHAQNMYHILENWKWFAEDVSLVENVAWRNVGTTNILEYLPEVLVFVAGRMIGLGIYPIILFARIASFICYLIGIYYAIKIIPIGKHLMLFCGALPMALRQATGITYDNMTVLALFLLVAVIFRIYYDGINRKWLILLAACCIVAGLCKTGIYTPIAILLCFVPKEKMGGIKKKWKYIAVIGLITMLTVLAQYGGTLRGVYKSELNSMQPVYDESVNNENGTDEAETKVTYYGFTYALREPLSFLKMYINTVLEQSRYQIAGVLGNRVPWANNEIPLWAFGLFGVVLLLSKNGIGEEMYPVTKRMRLGMVGTVSLVYLAFLVSFLVITPVYSTYVHGIQGRYFLPILPVILLMFRNNGSRQAVGTEKTLCLTYYFSAILYMASYLEIFMIHYRTFNYT